ncbi:hypothetical protein HELRODRAFT_184388 [Helobdella robusta]|uniref:Uncharacterized protein n=1 Tax=Helobdella robusta TaxID=6412 RepID=T1FL39_HELRO|nr:hypothetical protein HELRODRAFT_184388 [Helobdella robusta]ESN99672.1 hypothetical protein HELRODRAFT_184388 [Helobdella robusta]
MAGPHDGPKDFNDPQADEKKRLDRYVSLLCVAVVDLVKSCDKIPPDGQLCQAINDGTLKALVLTGTGFTGKCGVAITDEQLEKLNEVSVSSGANDLTPGDKHVLLMAGPHDGPKDFNDSQADEKKRLDRYVSLLWLKTGILGSALKTGVKPKVYDDSPFKKPEKLNASYQVYLFKQVTDRIFLNEESADYEITNDENMFFSLSNFVNKNLLCEHLLGTYEFRSVPNIPNKKDTTSMPNTEKTENTKKPFPVSTSVPNEANKSGAAISFVSLLVICLPTLNVLRVFKIY